MALKEPRLCAALSWMGRLLQRCGAAEQNARPYMVPSLVVEPGGAGITADLRVQVEDSGVMSAFIHLWVGSRIL